MGLVSTYDEYCRREDAALQGLNHIVKVVDDILVHDETFEDYASRLRSLIAQYRQHNIIINKNVLLSTRRSPVMLLQTVCSWKRSRS